MASNRPVSWPTESSTFMCYSIGQKVWKFHGLRSCDKLPGEDLAAGHSGLLKAGACLKVSLAPPEHNSRRLGRTCSVGSSYSSSESECSSQASPVSESMDEVSSDFLTIKPTSPNSNEAYTREECRKNMSDMDTSDVKLSEDARNCTEPADLTSLTNLINILLRKHTLVQNGLELLENQPGILRSGCINYRVN